VSIVHLVRHGRVENPGDLVYGVLPGFRLSEVGRVEAARQAKRLAGRDIGYVVASPLERAEETAEVIAAPHGLPVHADARLVEWGVTVHWAGLTWAQVRAERAEELATYFARPDELDLGERLDACADRVASAVRAAAALAGGREAVCVSHSDPISAGTLRILGRPLRDLASCRVPTGGSLTLHLDGAATRELGRY